VKAADVREVFETILPEEAVHDAARASGLQSRERKLDAQRLLRAMVISAATGYGGRYVIRLKSAGSRRCSRSHAKKTPAANGRGFGVGGGGANHNDRQLNRLNC
jgi:hypothetical protein